MAKFEPDYSRRTQYTNEYPFSSIIFPAGAPLLGEDGNELQDIIDNKREEFTAEIMTDGFIADIGYEDMVINWNTYPLQDNTNIRVKGSVLINAKSYNINLKLSKPRWKEYWWYLKISKFVVGSDKAKYIENNRFKEELSKRIYFECSLEAFETELADNRDERLLLLHTDSDTVVWKNTGIRLKVESVKRNIIDNTKINFGLYETDYICMGRVPCDDGYYYLYSDGKIVRSKDKISWHDTAFNFNDETIKGSGVTTSKDIVFAYTENRICIYRNNRWTSHSWDDTMINSAVLYRSSNGKLFVFLSISRANTKTYCYSLSADNGGTWSDLVETPNFVSATFSDDGQNVYAAQSKYYRQGSLYICEDVLIGDTVPSWEDSKISYKADEGMNLIIDNEKIYITNDNHELFVYDKKTFELVCSTDFRVNGAGSGTFFICGEYAYYIYSDSAFEIPVKTLAAQTEVVKKTIFGNEWFSFIYGAMQYYPIILNKPELYNCEGPIIVTNLGNDAANRGRTKVCMKINGSWTDNYLPSEYKELRGAVVNNDVLYVIVKKSYAGTSYVAKLKYSSSSSTYSWDISSVDVARSQSSYGNLSVSTVGNHIYIPYETNDDIKTVLISN